MHVLYELFMKSGHKHTATYLSALHSGTLSGDVTETDGQCVSVRWTQPKSKEKPNHIMLMGGLKTNETTIN